MFNPEATYDCLFISKQLQEKVTDFSEGEVQLFAYLACLLALYDGKAASSWGYMFIKNKYGSPFSDQLSGSIRDLENMNCLTDSDLDKYYSLSKSGENFLSAISDYPSNIKRKKYLEVATMMVDFFPYGILTRAIDSEPMLTSSRSIEQRRILLDEESSGIEDLYEQFELLRSAIADIDQKLITPAYVWLSSLAFFEERDPIANG